MEQEMRLLTKEESLWIRYRELNRILKEISLICQKNQNNPAFFEINPQISELNNKVLPKFSYIMNICFKEEQTKLEEVK
ncbi:MAG: hypothetical protein ABIB47_02315 [Candidatus Woesearchaeota archaeon]